MNTKLRKADELLLDAYCSLTVACCLCVKSMAQLIHFFVFLVLAVENSRIHSLKKYGAKIIAQFKTLVLAFFKIPWEFCIDI